MLEQEARNAYLRRGFSLFEGLLSTMIGSLVSILPRQKSAEFACRGSDGDVTMFALVQTHELFIQTVLSIESDGNNGRRLTLPMPVQDKLRSSTIMIIPSGLHQRSGDIIMHDGLTDSSSHLWQLIQRDICTWVYSTPVSELLEPRPRSQ